MQVGITFNETAVILSFPDPNGNAPAVSPAVPNGKALAVSLGVPNREVSSDHGDAWTAERNEASISLWTMSYPISSPVLRWATT